MQLLARLPGGWLDPFCADFAYTPRARVDVLWFSYTVHSRVFVYITTFFCCVWQFSSDEMRALLIERKYVDHFASSFHCVFCV